MTDPAKVKNRTLITVCVMLATVMQVLDMTIANVALPHMQGSLSAQQDTITWVLTSYIVASAIATPLTGWVSDRFGQKNVFLTAVAGFTVASVLCGLAMSLGEMVLFRLLQGVFGAALVPLSQTVLLDINPRERQPQAMALWGAGVMVGPILGPTLGGWLTDSFSWRWVFFINLPVGILAFIGMVFMLPEGAKRKRRFDMLGFALLSVGLGSLQFMLDRGERQDWFASPEIWIELCLAVSALWMFIIHLMSAREPFIDRRLFTDKNFMSALGLVGVIGAVIVGVSALMPQMLQGLMGYSTMASGFVLAPRGIGTMLVMLSFGRLSKYFDPRLIVALGLFLSFIAMRWMSQMPLVIGSWPIAFNCLLQGVSIGMMFAPMTIIALSTIEAQLRTDAAGIYSLMRNFGSSVGVSVLSTSLAQNLQINHAQLAEHVTPFNPALNAQVAGPIASLLSPWSANVIAMLDAEINRQALMIAYINDYKLMMYLMIACLPAVLLLRRPKPAPAKPGGAAASGPAAPNPALDMH